MAKTYSELLNGANTIKNETVAGANTATRVGTELVDIVEKIQQVDTDGLDLGTTSESAFRGDYGQEAYEHANTDGNPHNTVASEIGTTPAGGLSATTVQGAINELDSEKVGKTTKINGYSLNSDINLSKSDVGLSNVDNTSDVNKPISEATQNALSSKADLVGGKVPSAQLPAYVDDVLEYATLAAFPATGESGKMYVALNTNLTYRWSGTVYVEISKSLALGETSDTAYRGDRGKTAYDHSQATGNPHGTTAAQVANIPAGSVAATTVQGAINELAGDIVQVETNLNDISLKIGETIQIPTKKYGYYINLSVGVGGFVDINSPVVSATGYRYMIFDCIENDIIIVNGQGGDYPRLWAFLSNDYKIISVSIANFSASNLELIAPVNSRYIIINDKTSSFSYITSKVNLKSIFEEETNSLKLNLSKVNNFIGSSDEYVDIDDISIQTFDLNTGIIVGGGGQTSTVFKSTYYINVSKYKKLKIKVPTTLSGSSFGVNLYGSNYSDYKRGFPISAGVRGVEWLWVDLNDDEKNIRLTYWIEDTYGLFEMYGYINPDVTLKEYIDGSSDYIDCRWTYNLMRQRLYSNNYAIEVLDKNKLAKAISGLKYMKQLEFHGVSEYGQLQVIGSELSDKLGNPVQLRGVSLWNIAEGSQCCLREGLETLKRYGCNLVRVPMLPLSLGVYGYTQVGEGKWLMETYKSIVKDILSLDMYAMIDWHILSEGNPLKRIEEAKLFFSEICNDFIKNPGVIYEICNEPSANGDPTGDRWDNIRTYANEIIGRLRYRSPSCLVIVGTPGSSHDLATANSNRLSWNNIMYTYHRYLGDGGNNIITYKNLGLPVFVTECGAKDAANTSGGVGDNAYDLNGFQTFLNLMKINRVSWAAWALWQGNGLNPSNFFNAKNQDANLKSYGGWTYNDLNNYGKMVFNNFL